MPARNLPSFGVDRNEAAGLRVQPVKLAFGDREPRTVEPQLARINGVGDKGERHKIVKRLFDGQSLECTPAFGDAVVTVMAGPLVLRATQRIRNVPRAAPDSR